MPRPALPPPPPPLPCGGWRACRGTWRVRSAGALATWPAGCRRGSEAARRRGSSVQGGARRAWVRQGGGGWLPLSWRRAWRSHAGGGVAPAAPAGRHGRSGWQLPAAHCLIAAAGGAAMRRTARALAPASPALCIVPWPQQAAWHLARRPPRAAAAPPAAMGRPCASCTRGWFVPTAHALPWPPQLGGPCSQALVQQFFSATLVFDTPAATRTLAPLAVCGTLEGRPGPASTRCSGCWALVVLLGGCTRSMQEGSTRPPAVAGRCVPRRRQHCTAPIICL